MNETNLARDLYYTPEGQGWSGLFVQLKAQNKNRDSLITELTSCTKEYARNKSNFESAKLLWTASQDELEELKDDYFDITGESYSVSKENNKIPDDYKDNDKVQGIVYNIELLIPKIAQAETDYNTAQQELRRLDGRIEEINEDLKAIEQTTAELIENFEKKYIRFIQEASWISEDYIDDNLYYLDAETTLHKASQPKVSYTINVIELSQLEEYKNYVFDLGDITYIQDTGFFGWKEEGTYKTPYKEEIVITEMQTFFNNPEKSTIKVQNYRTSFEDLFKRLAASAQQIHFHSGEFQRAADIVDANGNIAPSCLEDAFSNNTYVLSNAANQTVKMDEYGITTTNDLNPAEILRITSGGMFLSNNGGDKWTTGITANGINAKVITTGQLDTGKINIFNGNQRSFAWDSQGLNAYRQNENGGYNPNQFVRFNQYGIFGVGDASKDFSSVDSIKNNASFYLGWDGLYFNKGTINWNNIALPENLEDIENTVNEINSAAQEFRNSQLSNRNYIIDPGNYVAGGSMEYLHIDNDAWTGGKEDGYVRFTKTKDTKGQHISIDCSEVLVAGQPYTISAKARLQNSKRESVEFVFGIREGASQNLGANNSVTITEDWTEVSCLVVPNGGHAYSRVYFSSSYFELNESIDIEWISITKGDQGNSAVSKLDTSVGQYLGLGGNTLINDSYVISPYIGGGYLNITNGTNSVIINPKGLSTDNANKIFEVKKGNSTVMSITTNGDATFSGKLVAATGEFTGKITATSGIIGGCTIDENGKLWITQANISGALTADSISVKSGNDTLFSAGSGSVTIGGFTVRKNSISIGDWTSGGAPANAFIGTGGYGNSYKICDKLSNMWVFGAGQAFGVLKDGTLYATGANISGTLKAGNNSTIGPWTISSGLSYSEVVSEHFAYVFKEETGLKITLSEYEVKIANFSLNTKGIFYTLSVESTNKTIAIGKDEKYLYDYFETESALKVYYNISSGTSVEKSIYWSKLANVQKL